jgi:hypothetical protein
VIRRIARDRVQWGESAADSGLFCFETTAVVGNWIGKRDGEDYETAFVDEGRRPNLEDARA